jgi:hypothetical protein
LLSTWRRFRGVYAVRGVASWGRHFWSAEARCNATLFIIDANQRLWSLEARWLGNVVCSVAVIRAQNILITFLFRLDLARRDSLRHCKG